MATQLKWLQAQIPADEWGKLNEKRKKLNIKWPALMASAVDDQLDRLEHDPKLLMTVSMRYENEKPPAAPTEAKATKVIKAPKKADEKGPKKAPKAQDKKTAARQPKRPKEAKAGEVVVLEDPAGPTEAEITEIAQEEQG